MSSCHHGQNKEKHGRELAWLAPKIDTAENRAAEIDGLMDQMNLRLSLLGSSHKKACEEVRDLKVRFVILCTALRQSVKGCRRFSAKMK